MQLYNPNRFTRKALTEDASLDAEFTTKSARTFPSQAVSRRHSLQFLGVAAGTVAMCGILATCRQDTGSETESSTIAETTTRTSLVRLSSVVTPRDGGLYDDLLPVFERQTGYQVELTAGEDVYGPARNGRADVVLSLFGHEDAQSFVQDGLGHWPQTVFFNQHTLLGPPSDPARVQDLTDLVEAFRRIARTRSPFVANNAGGIKYLTDVLWEAAGSPAKEGWYSDQGVQGHNEFVTLKVSENRVVRKLSF